MSGKGKKHRIHHPEDDVIDLTSEESITYLKPTVTIDDTIVLLDDTLEPEVASPRRKRKKSSGVEFEVVGPSCPVCLETFSLNKNLKPMTTPCGHVFCSECLSTVTKRKKVCPMCQRPVKFDKCIRLHL